MLTETLLVMAGLMMATVGQWMAFEHLAPFFREFDLHTKHEWIGRITASVVEVFVVCFTLLYGPSSVWGSPILLGYLLHDTGHMLIYEKDITTYLHHIVCTTLLGLMELTMSPAQAQSAYLATGVLESTSPILHATWLLKKAGYGDQPFFKYIAGGAAAFFGIMRIGVFPWVMMTKMDRVTAAVFSPILGLSIYWFYKIVKLMKKVIDKAETAATDVSSTAQSHAA